MRFTIDFRIARFLPFPYMEKPTFSVVITIADAAIFKGVSLWQNI